MTGRWGGCRWVVAACLLGVLLWSAAGVMLVAAARLQSPRILLFESTRSRAFNTYLLDIDRRIISEFPGPGNCYRAVWSPEGSRIACKSNAEGSPDLYVIDVFGGQIERLTESRAAEDDFAWSPDGRQIAFVAVEGQRQDIYVVDVETRVTRQITQGLGTFNFSPAWSPDGTQIAFRASRDGRPGLLFVVRADGGDLRVLADGSSNVSPLLWSPDGTQILFERAADVRFSQNLAIVDLTTRAISPLIEGSYNARPAWSPDGTAIAFVSRRDGDYALYLMSLGDPQPRNTGVPANTYTTPRWSQDGRQIVFDSWRAGASGIYLINADGTGEQRLTDSALDSNPAWMPQ
ncbi:DPP IV N-terminal domain-containing protein [Geitlerinema splendidum]|nr:DPP IV N-terminal domain-containing protein [Geitlerinema splendidum]